MNTVRDEARRHIKKGRAPLPLPYKSKAPALDEWQNLRLQEADLEEYFDGSPQNLGVILGAPSGDCTDVDLDAHEAVSLADDFLPKTGSMFGRASKPRSHREYTCSITTEKFADVTTPDGETAMLVEIRSTGGQTMFPPSVHPSGEPVEWAEDGEPARVEPAELRRAVVDLASAALLARHWPGPGARHETALAAAGLLARAGVEDACVVTIVAGAARAAGDAEWADRKRAALDTVSAVRAGEASTGGPRLAELLVGDGAKVVERLRRWLGADDVRAGESTPTEATPARGPIIDAGEQDLARVADAGWAALIGANAPPVVFRFAGHPARVAPDDQGGLVIQGLGVDELRHRLARIAEWTAERLVFGKRVAKPAHPPIAVVRDMLAHPDPPLPPLVRIAEVPIFTPTGAVLARPGYDAASGILFAPPPGLSVPEVPKRPSAADVARARALLLELLADFPFTGPGERALAVAMLIEPIVRDLIDGPTPLYLVEAPAPGTGKSLLAELPARIATGRPGAAMTEGRDEDEWRKRITAKLLTGALIVLLDNLRRRLASAAVASAVTAAVWEDRLLGRTEMVRVPVRCTWIATGNNPSLSAEMIRRSVRIRLDAKVDRPWLRDVKAFRHPDLRGWVVVHRGKLIWSALVLGQAWLAAGRRATGAPLLGMFESWSRVMGGILAAAEIPGFLTNLEEFYNITDAEGGEVRAFLSAWWETHRAAEVTAAQLLELAMAPASALDIDARTDQGRKIRFGKLLSDLRDRRYRLGEDLTVTVGQAGKLHQAALWRLVGENGRVGESVSPYRTRAREEFSGAEQTPTDSHTPRELHL